MIFAFIQLFLYCLVVYMAKSGSSNAWLWALILVAVFVAVGNWQRITDWFQKKEPVVIRTVPPSPSSNEKPLPQSSDPTPESEFEQKSDFLYATGKKVEIITHTAYTLGYVEEYEQPAWVAYKLTSKMTSGTNKREDNFRPDPDVRTGSAIPEDYRGSGYDRGHLAPVADFKQSAKWMDETFFMSNMSPQNNAFNAGIWSDLENKVRSWARAYKKLYVATGPILRKGLPTIGRRNQVAVPEKYYKVLYDITEPEIKAIGFILKNEGSQEPLESFAVSVDEVERQTGLDFYPLLPDPLETQLESSYDAALWFKKKGKSPKKKKRGD